MFESGADLGTVGPEEDRPDRRDRSRRGVRSTLRAYRWSILAFGLIFTAGGLLAAAAFPRHVRASARVLVLQAAGAPSIGTTGGGLVPPNIDMATEAQIARSAAVASVARAALRSAEDPAALARRADAVPAGRSHVLTISFTAGAGGPAAAGAQAFAESYLRFKAGQIASAVASQRSALDARLQTLQSQLDAANAEIASHPPGSRQVREADAKQQLLKDELAAAEQADAALQAFAVDPGQVIGPAAVPGAPLGPPLAAACVGLLVGSAAGLAQAFVRSARDGRLTDAADLERVLGAPVLAAIPRMARPAGGARGGWATRGSARGSARGAEESGRHRRRGIAILDDPDRPAAEAFRGLATAVVRALGDGGRTILVTGAGDGEGRTTIAVNLAVALTHANAAVALIDADLRHPRAHAILGASAAPGLVELLRGRVDLLRALQDVGIPRLRFIAGGDVSAGTPERFSPKRLAAIVDEIKAIGAIVVIDAAPLAVSDPLALVPYTDGVLFVANQALAGARSVPEMVERVTLAGGRLLGGVFIADAPGFDAPGSGADAGEDTERPDDPAADHQDVSVLAAFEPEAPPAVHKRVRTQF